MLRSAKSLGLIFRSELEYYPASTMCFSVSSIALTAAALGGAINYFLAELLAVLGLAMLGLIYLALGVWHRLADAPLAANPVRDQLADTLECVARDPAAGRSDGRARACETALTGIGNESAAAGSHLLRPSSREAFVKRHSRSGAGTGPSRAP